MKKSRNIYLKIKQKKPKLKIPTNPFKKIDSADIDLIFRALPLVVSIGLWLTRLGDRTVLFVTFGTAVVVA